MQSAWSWCQLAAVRGCRSWAATAGTDRQLQLLAQLGKLVQAGLLALEFTE
jgi:hypothetical protein